MTRSSQLKVVAGGGHLNVEVRGQGFIVDVWSKKGRWAFSVNRDAWGGAVVGGGLADTWAEAYRRALRTCDAVSGEWPAKKRETFTEGKKRRELARALVRPYAVRRD